MAGEKDKVIKEKSAAPPPSDYTAIPLNDYINHTKELYDTQFDKFFPAAQRDQQIQQDADFRQKYGQFAGNRGYWANIFNQFIPSENRRYGDVVLGVAANQGLNPKLLYGNANEEGFFKSLHGDVLGQDGTPEKGYNFNGQVLLGLDNFGDRINDLKKYLPENFDYRLKERINNKGEKVNTGFFKTPTDALTAMSAFLKLGSDSIDAYTKNRGIDLSPEAKDFFTMAAYNGGEGNAQKMIEYYRQKGLLKDNAFLQDSNLAKDKYGSIYENVRRRIDAVNGLEKEGELDFSPERIAVAKSGKKSWADENFQAYKRKSGNYDVLQPTDKKIPFEIVIAGNKKKVIPRGTDLTNIDANSLPDLDVYDYQNNLNLIKPKS